MAQLPEQNPYTRRVRRMARWRQGLALGLLVAAGVVLALYGLNRRAARRELAKHPDLAVPRLGLQIQQSARGVTISRDVDGHPAFRIFAARVDKLRHGGQEVLHDVRIEVYDKDGLHADKISGDEFGYDEATAQLSAHGQVHFDLQVPTPVHLEAHDLVYNVKAGTGTIAQGLTFQYLAARGSAGTAQLDSHAGQVDLGGGVQVDWQRPGGGGLEMASRQARIERLPSGAGDAAQVRLEQNATLQSGAQQLAADRMTFWVRRDETLRRLEVAGHVRARDATPGRAMQARAASGAADLATAAGRTFVNAARLAGGVELDQSDRRLTAGSVVFHFDREHQLDAVMALQQARLRLDPAQQVAAPELDFHLAPGAGRLRLAAVESQGRTQLDASGMPTPGAGAGDFAGIGGGGPVHAEADHLRLDLDATQQPTRALASGNVRTRQSWMVNGAPVTRTLRSDGLELRFAPAAGQAELARATARGAVEMQQGDRQLRADQVVYTAANRTAVATAAAASDYSHGQVRGSDPETQFAAPRMSWLAAADGADELDASGGVSLSRSACRANCGGTAMFNSGLALVITSDRLRWRQPAGTRAAPGTLPGIAVFDGQVRMLQSPNLLRADQITLDGARQLLTAQGHVETSVVENNPPGRVAPLPALAGPPRGGPTVVTIAADRLRYAQPSHQALYQGGVVMHLDSATLRAPRLALDFSAGAAPGLQRALASGGVKLEQPGRNGEAEQMSYDFARNQIELRGGPPSILDAEHGKISGDPLTFSLASDEIQVGSKSGTRASGQAVIPHSGHE